MTGFAEPSGSSPTELPAAGRPSLSGHLAIMRFDHWFKNVFVLPGLLVALSLLDGPPPTLWRNVVLGLLSIGFVASSNYIINEILDAPFDRLHPLKRNRPVPMGRVSLPLAYVQWIAVFALGLGLGWAVSPGFALVMAILFAMGCAYNIRPLRTKDRPWIDVLSEAANNPIRMLAGWEMVGSEAFAPASLLLTYWMIGCFFMAVKRYAELRELEKVTATAYRPSFAAYNEVNLLTSIVFYASAAMLFFGVFVMRYRLELVLSFPAVAYVMAVYFGIGLLDRSPAQRPELLYRERRLVLASVLCTAVMVLCLVIDMPWLDRLVEPLAPTR